MYVTAPPGDSHRLFIVTRPGVIRVAVDGVLQAAPFLDIHARVWTQNEAAMASMAFDPGYENPASLGYGLFYVYFVAPPTGGEANGAIHIEEFSADPAHTPNVANPTGRVVLTIPHNDSSNHYGGTLQFNPNDGLLYIATGDGGGAYNQFGNAQDTKKSLLGKLLRIDPHMAGSDPYSIPSGNPFHSEPRCDPPSGTTDCPEILAWGLRNPFRWSFDRATGDIAIGDVGQAAAEEVDYVPASATLASDNFGWPCYEGPPPQAPFPGCPPTPEVDPVFSYSHSGLSGSIAITGGVVVRDPALGSVVGRYLYADFYRGVIHSLQLATPMARDDRVEADLPTVAQLVSFGEDAEAHVYVVSLAGSVQRITCADCARVSVEQSTDQHDPTNTEPVRFTATFSEPVQDFDAGDVELSGSAGHAGASVSVSDSGDHQHYAIGVSGLSSDGTIAAAVAPGGAHGDAGTGNAGSTSIDNQVTYDTVAPSSTITFPSNDGHYDASGFVSGCVTAGAGDICGTASDDGAGVGHVDVSIRQDSTGYYWNGSAFVPGSESYHQASLTSGWSYSFTPPADDGYTVHSRATDNAGNVEQSASAVVFTYDAAPAKPPPAGGAGSSDFGAAAGSGTADDSSQQTTAAPAKPPARDATAPQLRVRAAHVQDVLRRGIVRLAVTCDEGCVARARGKARGLALRGVRRDLQAGKRVVLELRASKRVRRALARRGVVVISVRGSDAAGNLRTASLTVRVKRG